jgi:hypothetical protein
MRRIYIILIITIIAVQNLRSQKPVFGKVTYDELSMKDYKQDPGADAVILSDVGLVTLRYNDGFYLEYERDVKIKIINSNGFEYADIQIPYIFKDELLSYKATTYNLKNGEITRTPVSRKAFIKEKNTKFRNILKFNFPDVHEGSVIEYSYKLQSTEFIYSLFPWSFQSMIPVKLSSLSVAYPEFFIYKSIISGNPKLVRVNSAKWKEYFAGKQTEINMSTWRAETVPAFSDEPFIKNVTDNETKLTFELASVKFPNSSFEEISPNYNTLTKKLMERDDFRKNLLGNHNLNKDAQRLTVGLTNDIEKVKAIHKYISENILWNGEEDFLPSSTTKKIYTTKKGNNADINMMLIAMLRSINIKADPVILSTRSNGSINKLSAMMQQFNYLVANITVDGKNYMVDATDPLRPFDMLPFECLNGEGFIVSNNSGFINLMNAEKTEDNFRYDLLLSEKGSVSGNVEISRKGYSALTTRENLKLNGEEGYKEEFMENLSPYEINDYVIQNSENPDSDIVERCKIKIDSISISEEGNLILNPFLTFEENYNPFIYPERKYPVDFGCQVKNGYEIKLEIPDSYKIVSLPDNVNYILGKSDAVYRFTSEIIENSIIISSSLEVNKTRFSTEEYNSLRNFFINMLQSRTRLLILNKAQNL